MARSFSAWSHVVSMLFAQLTHAIGLNDVCDALRQATMVPTVRMYFNLFIWFIISLWIGGIQLNRQCFDYL
jgi:hypothetical protein